MIREGCTRYTGKIRVTDPGLPQPVYQVFDVRETTIAKDGQILLIPEITVDVYWTDLDEDVADISYVWGCLPIPCCYPAADHQSGEFAGE
ncbi:hypothetical protein GCM10010965_10810 [Caldalkalibacillus thermarum]|uniref:hypothetical protein n=1 Tax=Caldalkalibacillus thermarum TaxID=296745 RepID=UPI0016698B81|nr:hypothetical protein [Caldalkalibacillus thermarum]GGK19601.1 hypothetical protein GCM10010965_10810 [Caldalkalibacillus thermarum]